MTELEQLRKLLAEATPGPWKIERGKRCIQGPDTREGDSLVLTSMMGGATKWSHSPYSEYCVPGMKEGDANAALIVAAVNALPGLIARVEEMERLRAERDRAQRACEQMGARITALEISLAEMSDCQPLPKIYKYTGTAEVDVENMFDVGHRHVSGKKPYDYLKSWLSMLRPFAYATQDDSWGELEKLISIVMNNYVQILVKAETARAALRKEP